MGEMKGGGYGGNAALQLVPGTREATRDAYSPLNHRCRSSSFTIMGDRKGRVSSATRFVLGCLDRQRPGTRTEFSRLVAVVQT